MQYEKLINWIRENGGYVDEDVYVHTISPGNRSLCVRKAKDDKTKLIHVPKKCTIFSEKNDYTELGILFLKEYCKPDSFFRVYLDTLPKPENFASFHPVYLYDRSDFPEIKKIYPEIVPRLEILVNEVDVALEKICECKEIPEAYKTREWAKFCVAMVRTRSWDEFGFIPLADMMQHSQQNENTHSFRASEEIVLFSKKCEAGELTAYYKTATCTDLYLVYGILGGPVNFMGSSVEFTNLSNFKTNCMKKSGQQDKNPFVFYFSDNGLSEGSLIKARILSIDSKEVRSEPFAVENKVLSFENERKALNLLLNIVKRIEVSVAECPDRYRPFGVLCEIRKRIVENTVKQIYTLWLSYLEK